MGLASAAAGLGLGELIAVVTGLDTSPILVIADAVVRVSPQSVKEFAIHHFGTHDKPVLIIGTLIVLAVIATVIGVESLRRRAAGAAGIVVLGLIGIAAAVTAPDAGVDKVAPTVLATAASVGVLYWLRPRALESSDRRRFLGTLVGVAAAAAAGGFGGRYLQHYRFDVTESRRAVRLPKPVSRAKVPAGDAVSRVPGISPLVTSNDKFYRIDTALVVPRVSTKDWKLRIHGRVDRPMTLTFDQLLRRPMIERLITLTCVSNVVGGDLVSTARFLGVPLGPLLAEAGVHHDADQIATRSTDGWTCGTPTSVALDGRDAMLAVGMNGEPLPIEHGFPVRMIVPGLYGYVSGTKWIVDMELTRFADFDSYWIRRGWGVRGPIKTESRIDTPRASAHRKAGAVAVAGVAWAQHTGIAKVEVRVDDGPWQEARLGVAASKDTWRQWEWIWPASTGRHTLQVRATDRSGHTQTSQEADVLPDGATGWHTVSVTVD